MANSNRFSLLAPVLMVKHEQLVPIIPILHMAGDLNVLTLCVHALCNFAQLNHYFRKNVYYIQRWSAQK